eukprot:m.83353 g.83353  ORF g.83353 m.83353 type:complete len:251 (-) comp14764_c1_seq1:304-1056(-)
MASAEKSLDATNGAPGLAAPKTSDNTHAAASAVASSPLAAALIKQSPGRSTGTPRPRKRSRVAAAVTQPPTHLALPVAALNLATAATATEATTPQATPSQAAPSPSAPAPAPASASVTRAPAADTAAMSISGSTPRSPTSTIPQPAPQQQAQSPVTTVPHAAATTTATAFAVIFLLWHRRRRGSRVGHHSDDNTDVRDVHLAGSRLTCLLRLCGGLCSTYRRLSLSLSRVRRPTSWRLQQGGLWVALYVS